MNGVIYILHHLEPPGNEIFVKKMLKFKQIGKILTKHLCIFQEEEVINYN
jgi:hypothetical protein